MAVESNDKPLNEILAAVGKGIIQLPDFQRSWVWNDSQICKLIESVSSEYPMGAVMFLQNGGEAKFQSRLFTGVDKTNEKVEPDYLVLDGQQRLTTLYQVFNPNSPVETCLPTNRDKKISRYYYLDIKKCIDEDVDRLDAIVSVNEEKIIKSNIGREVILDLSTQEKEYEHLMFPLNIVFSITDFRKWERGYVNYYGTDSDETHLYDEFDNKVLSKVIQYKFPVIKLTKDTSSAAVCQIFENVNTGGVPLTVFELVTAQFATDTYELRKVWNDISLEFCKRSDHILDPEAVDGTKFLTSMTLLVTYIKSQKNDKYSTKCKKRDVLHLKLSDFEEYKNPLKEGFMDAADFLVHQGIYSINDLPYTSQLIPLAAIYAYDKLNGKRLSLQQNINRLSQWYWCGVLGEQYGGANESRFVLDITGIFRWINGGEQPETVSRGNFQALRLLSLQTRNSAAYKGIMALIMQDSPLDFMTHNKMDVATYLKEATDIHHIFPQVYCEKMNYQKAKWNSVINKTPIYASTNRSIGGRAPSEYIQTMFNKGLNEQQVTEAIESHKINYELLKTDSFDDFIRDRATRLLDRIGQAMGKETSGRDSEEVVKTFGSKL